MDHNPPAPEDSQDFKKLEELAERQQLLLLGRSDLQLSEDMAHFKKWLEQGMAADMFYMSQHLPVRYDAAKLLENATCALVFACQYHNKHDAAVIEGVAKYAQFKDYHAILRRRITAFAASLQVDSSRDRIIQYRVCVDTVPLLERALARKTGAGFIGKNACFISPSYGSFLLLGVLLLDQELPLTSRSDGSIKEDCGSCKRCIAHCPTGAIVNDRVIDARRCLSYWSIEHRGPVPREFWPFFKTYYYGCDICQDVCPFNRRSTPMTQSGLGPRSVMPELSAVALMNQNEYEQWFGGTPMTRAKKDGLQRNALLALWASGKFRELHLALAKLVDRADTTENLEKTIQDLQVACEG